MGYEAPHYWRDEYGSVTDEEKPVGGTFLTKNYCAINDEHFFVRGIIQLPILGSAEYFCWGVWGSLSHDSFKLVLEKDDDPAAPIFRRCFRG